VIDGIKIHCKLVDFSDWKSKTGISFDVPTDTDTGAMRGHNQKKNPDNVTYTHQGKFETYQLKVIETHIGDKHINYNLIIAGSLHKNYFGGKNYKRFGYDDMQTEIKHLCVSLHLQLGKCAIQNLEIGVNIQIPFEVTPYINKSVLLHSVVSFQNYVPDKKGFVLGRVATHSQHSIKCYDKGAQNALGYPLMRFEDRVTKMQYLKKYGIITLADLTIYEKVDALREVILNAWDNVLIYEPDIYQEKLSLTSNQHKLLIEGKNRDYWERLKNERPGFFNKQRAKFKQFMLAYSAFKTHQCIKDLIHTEWTVLLKTGTILPGVKHLANNANGNNFTVKVKGKKVPLPEIVLNFNSQRICASCGRDISLQHPKSKYCSAKVAGEQGAHKCRNKNSNPRNNYSRQLDKINSRGQTLFDQTPYLRGQVQNHGT
jgi:hypothetical protein